MQIELKNKDINIIKKVRQPTIDDYQEKMTYRRWMTGMHIPALRVQHFLTCKFIQRMPI